MLGTILSLITISDWKYKKISNQYIGMLIIWSILDCLISHKIDMKERIMGIGIILIPLLILYIFRMNLLGGGDIKLLGTAGFIVGSRKIYVLFSIAVYLAFLYIIYRKIRKKKDQQIPFGPFISIALLYIYITI